MQRLSNEDKIRPKAKIAGWPLLALAYQFLPRVEGLHEITFGRRTVAGGNEVQSEKIYELEEVHPDEGE